MPGQKLDEKTIREIEAILQKGQRIELIPTKDGMRIFKIVRREESSVTDLHRSVRRGHALFV